MITDRRLFPRENSQRMRGGWSAKRGLFSTLSRGVRTGLACRDACIGLTCPKKKRHPSNEGRRSRPKADQPHRVICAANCILTDNGATEPGPQLWGEARGFAEKQINHWE